MGYLLIATLIQTFSFSLIGECLTGHVDSYFAVLVRVVLAGLVFIPLTHWRQVGSRFAYGMLLIGVLQLGITYVCLYLSFQVLTVPEVLLFTIITPLHVTLIEDAFNRRFNPWALVASLIAMSGAAVIRFDSISGDFFKGFLLLQLANFTYAAGQVMYRFLMACYPSNQPGYRHFGFFYLGALAVVLPAFLLFGKADFLPDTTFQWGVMVFLGLVSTALGMYWWNEGACLVSGGTLAVMNNLHVPVGLLFNLLIWNPHEQIWRLLIGGLVIILAIWISRLDRMAVTI